MEEAKIYQLRKIYPPVLIRKITWVFRDKEFYQHAAFGIWWDKNTGLKIANKNRELKYFMIGLYLGKYITWIEFTYTRKCKSNNGLSIPEQNLNSHLKN
jgi:hypothetical protein